MHADRFAVALVAAVFLSLNTIAAAQPVTMSYDLRTDNPVGDFNQLVPGDNVWFDLAVSVDPDFDPLNRAGVSNNGLATLVYDVTSLEAQARGYILNQTEDAFSGFSSDDSPQPATVSNNFYSPSASSFPYPGGWGFNRAGLPGGGNVTQSPGNIIAAGITAPLTWTADVHPNLTGLQPLARENVGHGTYTFVDDDPILAGHTGGFGLSVELGNTRLCLKTPFVADISE